MARAGRKRKEGPREPNGRLSRAAKKVTEPASPGQVRRLRDAALRRMADAQWGSELGRHFLSGGLSDVEYSAGQKYWLLREAYEGRRQATSRTFDEIASIFAALSDARSAVLRSGYKNWAVLRRVIERDAFTPGAAEALHLREALQALVQLWGMDGRPAID